MVCGWRQWGERRAAHANIHTHTHTQPFEDYALVQSQQALCVVARRIRQSPQRYRRSASAVAGWSKRSARMGYPRRIAAGGPPPRLKAPRVMRLAQSHSITDG